MNLHLHDHSIFLDGVFAKQPDGSARFVPSRAPSQTEIVKVAADVGRRVIKWLRRHGYIDHEGDESVGLEQQTAMDACMQVCMSSGSFERITERGEPDATIDRDDARFDQRRRSPWSGEADGFSVHAGVCIRAGDTAGRERLVRYCARPALSLERLSVLPNGLIAYRTKYQEEVCSKILTHLKLPLHPEELSDGAVVYDVTAEPVFDSDEWMENAASVSRGPPSNRDGIDPPTPAE